MAGYCLFDNTHSFTSQSESWTLCWQSSTSAPYKGGAKSQKTVKCFNTAIKTCSHNQTSPVLSAIFNSHVNFTFPSTARSTWKPLTFILSARYLFAFIIFVMHTARAAHLILHDPMTLTVYWHHLCNSLPDLFIIMYFRECYETKHKVCLLFNLSPVQIQYCLAQSL